MKKLRFKSLSFFICIMLILNFSPIIKPLTIQAQPVNAVSVSYQGHVQNIGWQNWVSNGQEAGTNGKSLRLEALKIKIVNAPAGTIIKYQAHVQNIGWQNWVSNGQIAGTTGKSLRMEAIKITLVNMPGYSVQYQTYVQNIGWQLWVSDGQISGTTGKSLRIETIRIRIVVTTKDAFNETLSESTLNSVESTSITKNFILVDLSQQEVYIFYGTDHKWKLINSFSCGSGKASTPTIRGHFRLGIKGLYFISGTSIYCRYFSQISGNYLFHSILYDKNGNVIDGTLGVEESHGCVRLALANAKYIYDNIPTGSEIWIK